MKTTLFCIVFLLLIAARFGASPSQGAPPRIVVSSESPELRLQNVHIDPHDGKVRGTAYLNFGYAAPLLPHVHVYALDGSGKIVYQGCDKLSGDLLGPASAARERQGYLLSEASRKSQWDYHHQSCGEQRARQLQNG